MPSSGGFSGSVGFTPAGGLISDDNMRWPSARIVGGMPVDAPHWTAADRNDTMRSRVMFSATILRISSSV